MAKASGIIGYIIESETAPSVWTKSFVDKKYRGDLISSGYRVQSNNQVSEDIRMLNRISFIADSFANANYHRIRYATYKNVKWSVTEVDDSRYPRLILTLGGVYNG